MKRNIAILIILITLAMGTLAGCNSAISTATANSGLSTVTRLALGIMKLEGTSQAVSATQAGELLTLWQGYQSLFRSSTSAQLELEAVIKQIEGSLTSDQLKAIDAMSLTEQSVSSTLNTLGGNATSVAISSTSNVSKSSNFANQGGPGGGPGGIGPGVDSSGLGEVLNGASPQSTPAATQSTASAGSEQVSPMLLRAVIQMLETRSQATG